MPRLVRRAPLSERLKAYLDPSDWLIWASEELNSSDWEDFAASYAAYIGFGANLLFVLAQANSGAATANDDDGVFKEVSGPGWLKWMMNLLVLVLVGSSFGNAWLVRGQKRYYRLFEQNVEIAPQTPSAKRVKVDSSPAGASPLSFVRSLVVNSAASRVHPDAERDVWEIAVWDPNPLCLQLFCLFSPLHVVLYYFNLPVAPLDPRPSVRVTTTILIGAALSLHLWWLRTSFAQQTKDNAIISREVLHEYDSKFVHPALQKPCRDVGIQTISRKRNRDSSVGVKGTSESLASEVVTYTPTIIINRTFRTNPNANYASQYDPDNFASTSVVRTQQTPSLRPSYASSQYTSTSTATGGDFSSPIRQSHTPNPFRHAHPIPRTNDGGYLGVNTHAASPLRKAASTNSIRDDRSGIERSREGAASFDVYGKPIHSSGSRVRDSLGGVAERRERSPSKREGSPLKRSSMPSGERPLSQAERLGRASGYGGLGVGRRESGRF